jgi:hypothetical protein
MPLRFQVPQDIICEYDDIELLSGSNPARRIYPANRFDRHRLTRFALVLFPQIRQNSTGCH